MMGKRCDSGPAGPCWRSGLRVLRRRAVVRKAHADEIPHFLFEVRRVLLKPCYLEGFGNERVFRTPAVDADGVEGHGVEEAVEIARVCAQVFREPFGEPVHAIEIPAFEHGQAFGAYVRFDDSEQQVAVRQVVTMAVQLLRPDFGKNVERIRASFGVCGKQRCAVVFPRVRAEFQEYLLFRRDVFVQGGMRPAEFSEMALSVISW